MLRGVDGVVMQGRVVGAGQVPDRECGDPQRERDERVPEEAKPLDGGNREQRPQERAVQPEDDEQGREVTEQQVLRHVSPEVRVGKQQPGEMQVYPAMKQLTLDLAATSFLGADIGPEVDEITRAFIDMVAAAVAPIRRPLPFTQMGRGVAGRKRMTCGADSGEMPRHGAGSACGQAARPPTPRRGTNLAPALVPCLSMRSRPGSE